MPKMAKESFSKPSLPWKTRIAVSVVSAVTDKARRPDGSINRRLLRFLEFHSRPNPKPVNSVSSSDVPVDLSRNLWFRLFSPVADSRERLPVIVFFHGGGFAFLSPSFNFYDAVCRRFAKEIRAHVVSVNYRLSPEHRFPSQYDDGFDVLRFLKDNRAEALPPTADLSRCFLAGDSAGGNIAHHVAVRICRAGFGSGSGFETLRLAGLISIQPFFGGEERTESDIRLADGPIVSLSRTDWLWNAFLPAGSNRDHEAVNVSGPNAVELSCMGFPDTIVFVAGFDPLQDWQRRYYQWLKKSGIRTTLVEYPNMIHAFYIFPELREAGQLITRVKQFIQRE